MRRGRSRSELPYFLPLQVGRDTATFAHLEPMTLVVSTDTKPSGVRIDVVFSNHCFSDTFDPDVHTGAVVDVWDGQRRRVFDQLRYDLSLALPGIVRDLPTSPVFRTPEANFVRIAAPPAGIPGTDYRMFFRLKRERAQQFDLKMRVESAYSPSPAEALSASAMTKVRFRVLVDKTFRGEPISFHQKR